MARLKSFICRFRVRCPRLRSTSLAALLTVLAIAGIATADTPLEEFAAKLDRAANKDDFVGLAVAVLQDDQVVLLETYGTREVDGRDLVTPDTVFRIASLSKGFSAGLAALLVEDGRLTWDKRVSDDVPDFTLENRAQTRSATVGHVLSHRVGLPPHAYDNLLEAGTPPRTILHRFEEVELICEVGSCYAYQNVAFNMIADIVAKANGASFEESMRRRIFEPLGTQSASVGRAALTTSDNWARPHVRGRNGRWRTATVDQAYYNVPAAGGVNASITDMALWLRAQMGGSPDVLSPSVLSWLHEPVVPTKAETRRWGVAPGRLRSSHYGLGWRIYDYAGHTVINHSGGVEGYMAQIAFLPELRTGIVILANTRARRVPRILPTFLDLQLGLPDMDWLWLDEDTATGSVPSNTSTR